MIVAVVDPGSGNLNSVARALSKAADMAGLSATIQVTTDAAAVRRADRVVLPGQGAFAACQRGLASLPGMIDALEEAGQTSARPFLGICVGMQLLAERGLEHGTTPGLGWLTGEVDAMNPLDAEGAPLPLPQMGWNRLQPCRPHPVFKGLPGDAHGYFVHSYAWMHGAVDDLLATADYGGPVAAIVGRHNIVGMQFHVEKSGLAGLTILANFLRWSP